MKTVEGVQISGFGYEGLVQDLETYCVISARARDHLRAAASAGVKVEIQRDGGKCEAVNGVVTVSRDACLGEGGLTSATYLTESVLFELQNAINSKSYGKLRGQAMRGELSILQYGFETIKLEFESTAKLVPILQDVQRSRRPISPWGRKQIEGYGQGVANSANQPHDPNPTSHDEQRLPSKLFYAYSFLQDSVRLVKNSKLPLKKVATIKKGGEALDGLAWSTLAANWGQAYPLVSAPQFFVNYIDALLWLENGVGWSIYWQGGSRLDWKTCATAFVETAPSLRHDATMTAAIKRGIEAALPG